MKNFVLKKHEVHLWHASLVIELDRESELMLLLSPDEKVRAEKFKFYIHRQRYIAARGILRCILSHYLGIKAQDIQFSYYLHGKPYLLQTNLQFNLSHSCDIAVYALTLDNAIGVDIEKIGKTYCDALAKRFFNQKEYRQLTELPILQRTHAFYRIWSRKEAILKAMGAGLSFPLSQFWVSLDSQKQQVSLNFNGISNWHLESFILHPEYESAFAVQSEVEKICYWKWFV